MVHAEFDGRFFTAFFPIDELRHTAANDLLKPSGEIVTSPYHLVVVEQLRAEALAGSPAPKSVPVDVFIFGRGEPDHRAATKVGGLPYWPKASAWPDNGDDRPLTFVGQLCFADSRDILPDVPADVLLIFGDQDRLLDDNPSALRFYWAHIADVELVDRNDVPETGWPIAPAFGYRHRTVDYVEEVAAFRQYHKPYLLSRIEGTKIGGAPRHVQYDPALQGTFLGTLGSISPEQTRAYPFVNSRPPLNFDSSDELMWGDVGSLYLSVKADGAIDWSIQGY